MNRFGAVMLTGLAVVVASCSSSGTDTAPSASTVEMSPGDQRFPDVVDADATRNDRGWRFDVTISSPYDSPDRYADAWRVVGPDGTVYGIRELTHDHASEQPFTRSLDGVAIPDGVERVTIEAHDQRYGWGGSTIDVVLEP